MRVCIHFLESWLLLIFYRCMDYIHRWDTHQNLIDFVVYFREWDKLDISTFILMYVLLFTNENSINNHHRQPIEIAALHTNIRYVCLMVHFPSLHMQCGCVQFAFGIQINVTFDGSHQNSLSSHKFLFISYYIRITDVAIFYVSCSWFTLCSNISV